MHPRRLAGQRAGVDTVATRRRGFIAVVFLGAMGIRPHWNPCIFRATDPGPPRMNWIRSFVAFCGWLSSKSAPDKPRRVATTSPLAYKCSEQIGNDKAQSMHAYIVRKPAGESQRTELPYPILGLNQVLGRTSASGVNPLETEVKSWQSRPC